jgi:hypothetical protein
LTSKEIFEKCFEKIDQNLKEIYDFVCWEIYFVDFS